MTAPPKSSLESEHEAFGNPFCQHGLDKWQNLESGWFDEQSIAPPTVMLDDAREFLAKLSKFPLPAPKPYIAADGEIGFRWISPLGFASISFLDDKNIVGTVRSKKDGQLMNIDCPFIFWSEYSELSQVISDFVFKK